jgi:hypothetical protein
VVEATESSHLYLSSLFAKKFDAEQSASVQTEPSGDIWISVTVSPGTSKRLLASRAKELEMESDSPFVILSAHRTGQIFNFQVRLGNEAVAKVREFCY